MEWIKKIALLFIVALSLPISNSYSNIKVGTVAFDPPYVISLSQGFEINLIRILCRHLNEQCDLIPMKYQDLFPALDNGQIDIAMDGIDFFITPNQFNGNYIYSEPYLLSKGQFLASKNKDITSVNKLPNNANVGLVQENNSPEQGIFYNFFITHYTPKLNVTLFKDLDSLIAALDAGTITAAFLDSNEAEYWELNGSGKFHALDKPIKVADGIGIAALPKNKPVIQQLNQQLLTIENDQEYINLYNAYFGI